MSAASGTLHSALHLSMCSGYPPRQVRSLNTQSYFAGWGRRSCLHLTVLALVQADSSAASSTLVASGSAKPVVDASNEGRSRSGSRRRKSTEERHQELVAYCEQHGNCVVPYIYPGGKQFHSEVLSAPITLVPPTPHPNLLPTLLASWPRYWSACKVGAIPSSLPFSCGMLNVWLLPPPLFGEFVPAGLGRWVAEQRLRWRLGRLPLQEYRALVALGFVFDAHRGRWLSHFQQLAAFHSSHGHCNVRNNAPTAADFPGLYAWVLQQRQLWRRGLLDDERTRRLDGLGFVWQPQVAKWEQRVAELLAFREVREVCRRRGVGVGVGMGAGVRCGCVGG
jgi:hypothetical protein